MPVAPNEVPLLEFDPNPVAVINPSMYPPIPGFPSRAVITWFGDVARRRTAELQPVAHVPFEHGDHPIYVVHHCGDPVAFTYAAVGAAGAVGAIEVMGALGARSFVACGGAGIVKPGFDVGHVIVPTGAVRDEGTSYHYAPATAAVGPHDDAVASIVATLDAEGVPYEAGLTWTTDGFFRETVDKVARRREQGCLCVEMEAAAMFACATFRGYRYGQLLYAGDDVSAEQWDHRHWDRQHTVRERLLDLAFDAVLRL